MRPTTTCSRTARGAEPALRSLVVVVLIVAGCRREAAPCERRADHSVVACVDARPVTVAEVSEHLRPLSPVDGSASLGSPRQAALEAALRVRVFADEARRRGLAGGGDGRDARSRAVLHQALVRDEVARAHAGPDDVPLDEARRYYETRPGEFNKIPAVYVRAIYRRDPAAAEAAYREVRALDDDGFEAAGGVDLGEAHAEGFDPLVRRLANDLRAAGDVKGPVATSDGRWVILRAIRVELQPRPFEDAARDVQHALAQRRERAALDALYAKLAPTHRIEVFDDELARLPDPPERAR